jgi:hypothetical protein
LAIENSASRFAICSSFVLYLFRTLEAYFGFVPLGAAKSFNIYAAYFTLPFDMSFDANTNEPIMATRDDIRTGRKQAISDVATIILLCPILSPFEYAPFDRGGREEELGLLHWRHLGDCLVIAFFFQQGLSVSFSVFGIAIQSTLGYRCTPMMKSPGDEPERLLGTTMERPGTRGDEAGIVQARETKYVRIRQSRRRWRCSSRAASSTSGSCTPASCTGSSMTTTTAIIAES